MPRILITYTYYDTAVAQFNLRYFLQKGLIPWGYDVDHIFVINGYVCPISIPAYPHIQVIYRENKGYDFGGHAVALESVVGIHYDYYIFLNSGVMGPFLLSDKMGLWVNPFISKINESVKLVGTTIVCLPDSDAGGPGPRVEGFFFVTDSVGLGLLQKEKTIFTQHSTKEDAVLNGEYGLSRCILSHGFNLDCMLSKYENIDWTDQTNWGVNSCLHPSRKDSYFGVSIDPYEVVFHKWYWACEPHRPVSFDVVLAHLRKTVGEVAFKIDMTKFKFYVK